MAQRKRRPKRHTFSVNANTFYLARRLLVRMMTGGIRIHKLSSEFWDAALYTLEKELDRIEDQRHERERPRPKDR